MRIPAAAAQPGRARWYDDRVKSRRKNISAGDLGIDLASRREGERFKWFLACLLFGKPIQQAVARRAYEEFVKEGLVTPEAILSAGWDRLVAVLDRGHYVRYDFSTATRLLETCQTLKERYGSLSNLLGQAKRERDTASRLQRFKGIGPVTTRIFLRGIRGMWR